MRPIEITVKNYRPFEDTEPARLEIGPGFTALIGPNNSGKSAMLKLFIELRQLLQTLAPAGRFADVANAPGLGVGIASVDDPAEIFTNLNDRPITIELALASPQEDELARIRLETVGRVANSWMVQLFTADGERVTERNGPQLLTRQGRPLDGSALSGAIAVLGNSLYIGPYRNAITEGAGTYYDVRIGTSFIALWDEWKTGPIREQNRRVQQITNDIARIFGYGRLEINSAQGHNLLQAIIDGKPYRLRELGAGLAQFIVVLGNVGIFGPRLLLIDEPELNLHPTLQADFLTTLASYAAEGVIYATHSIGLARSLAEHIFAFQLSEGRAIVRPFEQTLNYPEFVGELSYSSYRELGYGTLLLVEGVTDVRTVQQFLRAFRKDHQVVVLPLGGRGLIRGGDIAPELHELKRLSAKVAALIDSERSAPDGEPIPEAQGFSDVCSRLGVDVHVTDRRALENYLTGRAIRKVLGADYDALGPYELLKKAQKPWAKRENWRIAREMTPDEIAATDVGSFLQRL